MPIIVDDPALSSSSATLQLCAIWMNDATEPADLCNFRYAEDSFGLTVTPRAEVRQLANRRRVVRRGTRTYTAIGLSLISCTPTQIQWLVDHVGEIICVRDHVGTKVYGTYLELPREVLTRVRDKANVKLTIEQITFSEAL